MLTMKKTHATKPRANKVNDMLPEYHLDYRKVRSNRFIKKIDQNRRVIIPDSGVSKIFENKEAMEDIALVCAIKEGEVTESVNRTEVFSILEGKA